MSTQENPEQIEGVTCSASDSRVGGSIPEEKQYANAKHAVETGDESAKTELAWFMLSGRGGAVVDADGAVELLEERVKEGDVEAMWMLGLCKEYGRGTEQDCEGATELYEKSCSRTRKTISTRPASSVSIRC